MLNMCIPIPSRLPPDPIRSSETLISGSCNDSLPFTSPLPVAASDRSALAMEDGCKEAEEQSELNQESDVGGGEKAVEEQESNGGGEKVLEEQESDGGGEKGLEERGHEIVDGDKKVLGEVGETGNDVDGDDREESPSSSPIRFRDLRKYPKSIARRSQYDPFKFYSGSNGLRFNSSSDFDDDCSDTVLHMHASSSHPPPPSTPPVGAGLANMGNTCFLNAVMQCFTHTVPLVRGLHSLCDYGVPRHHNEGEFCVLSAVSDHVFQALAASGEVIFPDNLVNNLSYISSFFQRFQQEDAHEYLQCLLDKIDTCWSKCKVDNKGVSSQGDSLVKQVFGGRLVSQLYCCNCGSRSDTYEPLVDLSLEIEDADDLNGALKSFTKMEENEDEVNFTCEKCKEQVPLKKQLLIDQAPSVATLHLKRFKGDGYFVEKIDKALEYPLELDLKPYTVGSENENVDLKYELYAVIVHMGFSSTSGHYLCYIRSSPDKWFRIDDSKITEVQEEVALSQQGYILFYARKGTPWPCSLVKSSCDNGIWNTSPKSVLDNVEHTQHSNAQEASLCSANAIENCTAMEASTERELPYQHAFAAKAFDEACCIGPSRNTDEVASSEPSTITENEVCNEESIAGNSSSLSGPPKDKEAENTRSADARVPVLINDSSRKPKEDLLFNDDFVDGHSRHVPTGNSTEFSTPPPRSSIEHEINGSKGNANFSRPSKSRSPSPDIYSESEDHPEAAHPRPLKKPKVVNSATPRKAMTSKDRKMKEACRSVRGFAPGRRRMLMAALSGSRSEGSMSKNKRRLGY